MRQVDLLPAAFAQVTLDLVAAVGEGDGLGRRGRWGCGRHRLRDCTVAIGRIEEGPGVYVVRIQPEGVGRQFADLVPIARDQSLLRLVEQAVDLALNAFAWHPQLFSDARDSEIIAAAT